MEPDDPRTYLAAERTFLAWIRTGLALMGFGFIAARFGLFLREEFPSAQKIRHAGISLPVGVTLLVLGAIVILCSGVRHKRYVDALARGSFQDVFGTTFAYVVVGILVLIGLGLAVYLSFI